MHTYNPKWRQSGHKGSVQKALANIGELPDEPTLILDKDIPSSNGRESVVYVIRVIAPPNLSRTIVAKFDDPSVLQREADNGKRLGQWDRPHNLLLPSHFDRTDGLILYEAPNIAGANRYCSLGEFLSDKLSGSSNQAIRAVSRLLQYLDSLTRELDRTSHCNGRTLHWRDIFPTLLGGYQRLLELAPQWLPSDSVQNLIASLDSLLNDETGIVWTGSVHGDLNLTNILVAVDGSYQFVDLVVIDWAEAKDKVYWALDHARLEFELWHSFYPAFFKATGGSPDHPQLRRARTFLDRGGALEDDELPGCILNLCRAIATIRTKVSQMGQGLTANYALDDYHHALACCHLHSLLYESTHSDEVRRALALLGADASLRHVQTLRQSEGAVFSSEPLVARLNDCLDKIGRRRVHVEKPQRTVNINISTNRVSADPTTKADRQQNTDPMRALGLVDYRDHQLRPVHRFCTWFVGGENFVTCSEAVSLLAPLPKESIVIQFPALSVTVKGISEARIPNAAAMDGRTNVPSPGLLIRRRPPEEIERIGLYTQPRLIESVNKKTPLRALALIHPDSNEIALIELSKFVRDSVFGGLILSATQQEGTKSLVPGSPVLDPDGCAVAVLCRSQGPYVIAIPVTPGLLI